MATLRPNPWGLYDMYGNVKQWVEDASVSTFSTAPVTDPLMIGNTVRSIRGSAFINHADGSTTRSSYEGSRALCIIGFRLVRTLR